MISTLSRPPVKRLPGGNIFASSTAASNQSFTNYNLTNATTINIYNNNVIFIMEKLVSATNISFLNTDISYDKPPTILAIPPTKPNPNSLRNSTNQHMVVLPYPPIHFTGIIPTTSNTNCFTYPSTYYIPTKASSG